MKKECNAEDEDMTHNHGRRASTAIELLEHTLLIRRCSLDEQKKYNCVGQPYIVTTRFSREPIAAFEFLADVFCEPCLVHFHKLFDT